MITNEEAMKTIVAFAENDMNVRRTSKALFLYDYAVYCRLNRIEKLTGLNPRRFYDLNKLLNKIKRGERLI